jgi:hypothetical protein
LCNRPDLLRIGFLRLFPTGFCLHMVQSRALMFRLTSTGILLALVFTGCDSAAPLGQPVDLVSFARLVADRTAAAEGFPWPREAESAVAAVRDGHQGTGWRPPGESVLESLELVSREPGIEMPAAEIVPSGEEHPKTGDRVLYKML